MTGSTPPETSGGSSTPLTREQLEGYVTALKSMIKEHNSRRDTVEPLRLDFEDETTLDKGEPTNKKKEIVTGNKVKDEDLAKPFKEVSKSPFSRRIIEFSAPEHKMPTHIKLYDGSTDPQDHLNRFTGAAGHGEWPMPVWCRMFQQTLDGKARGWFDGLPPGSIDEWAAFKDQFEARFSLHKACVKDPTEIAKIVRKANETLPEFKERWTTETGFIQGAPEIMRISSFMNGCKCPELAKRFADTIPKTVEEMMIRVDDFVRSEEAFASTELPRGEHYDTTRRASTGPFRKDERAVRGHYGGDRKNEGRHAYSGRDRGSSHRHGDRSAPYSPHRGDHLNRGNPRLTLDSLIKPPKEILATKHQLRLPPPKPMRDHPRKENQDKYCDYHGEKGHYTNDCYQLKRQLEIALESGKLNHLVKDLRQKGRREPPKNDAGAKDKVINMIRTWPERRKRKSSEQEERWMNVPITFPPLPDGDVSNDPLIVEATMEGYFVKP